MARKIKRFLVFLLFSIFFSLFSGKLGIVSKVEKKKENSASIDVKKLAVMSNTAQAAGDDPYCGEDD